MKNQTIILFIVLLNVSGVLAQNYQTFNSGRIVYYADGTGTIKCVRIDSVAYTSDSVLYPFSNIQQLDENCYTPYVPSWIGEKVLVRNNGDNVFFNKEMDSVKILTNAGLNDTWIAYELTDSTRVLAKVIKIGKIDFLGLQDSAKTIGFSMYDKNLNPISSNLDTTTIVLSKRYGLIKTLNFFLFPNYTTYYYQKHLEEYDLAGLSDPLVGVQNLTWMDVHDFQVGDELHELYTSSSWGAGYDYYETKKTISRYIDRTDYPDSVVYQIDRTRGTLLNDTGYTYLHDTVRQVIKPDPNFNRLPGEPIITGSEAYAYSMTANSKTQPSMYDEFGPGSDPCWTNCCADGCFPAYTYLAGLGGPYFHCDNAFSGGGTENKLVYYKKGNVTWGTPLVITRLTETTQGSYIKVYPNPATDFVKFKTTNSDLPCSFELFNGNGQKIMASRINSTQYSLDVRAIKPGFYFYRISNDKGTINYGKLMVR